jgi:prepilin-type N-terminal cleavage/methylation domain
MLYSLKGEIMSEIMSQTDKKTRKHDNKGMSLVELIIVIAILAALAATIGLSVIHYIEKGRQAKDLYHASIIKDAMNVYTFPSNMQGYDVYYTDPVTHVSEHFKRAWVYVDKEEIRCSNPSCALAMIDAGLVSVSPEFEEQLRASEESADPADWYWPSGPDGDYTEKTNVPEYVFVNDLHTYARRDWNTYQIDLYLDDWGCFHLGASASNTIRSQGHEKDVETAKYFANALGFTDAKATPIGGQHSARPGN